VDRVLVEVVARLDMPVLGGEDEVIAVAVSGHVGPDSAGNGVVAGQ